MPTSAKDLLHYLKTCTTDRLLTVARQKAFRAKPLPNGIEITPESTGEPRRIPLERIQRFCDEFAVRESLNPGDYRDVTFDASYLITILDSYRSQGGGR